MVDGDDLAAVAEVLGSDWWTTGPAVSAFERALADRVDVRHAIVCSSGTAALHLAALAMQLGPGDAAIVPSVTFVATANALRYVGAEVIFADVDADSGLMTADHLKQALSRSENDNVRAVLPVHLAGQCFDPAAIARVARAHGLAVIEDGAHALGTLYGADEAQVAVGACRDSDMATFSFHPVKTVAMGEGGAITTENDELAERLRCLRSHGMIRDPDRFVNHDLARTADGRNNPWYYEVSELGFNYRASDIHCALGLSQLGRLDLSLQRRRELVARYDTGLGCLAPAIKPPSRTSNCWPGWHLYSVQVDFAALGSDRATVMDELRKLGISSQVHYIPVHLQPYYRNRYQTPCLPGAETYYARTLSLPLFAGMTVQDVDRVVAALATITGLP